MDMREREMGLEEFGEFLLRRRIVPEKNAKYYVGWVRKFLGLAADPKLSLENRIEDFVEGLRRDGSREDWQVEQAERAVKTFFHAFRNGAGLEDRPAARVERERGQSGKRAGGHGVGTAKASKWRTGKLPLCIGPFRHKDNYA